MIALETLADQELHLADELAAIRGSRTERESAVASAGLDVAYRAVLRGYLAIATEPAHELEAIKRAAYIAWCASREARSRGGFGAITSDQIDEVLQRIDQLLRTGRDDDELWAILAHCHAMVPRPFERLSSRCAIRLLIERSARDDHASRVHIPVNPWQRGYLGFVFASKRT